MNIDEKLIEILKELKHCEFRYGNNPLTTFCDLQKIYDNKGDFECSLQNFDVIDYEQGIKCNPLCDYYFKKLYIDHLMELNKDGN